MTFVLPGRGRSGGVRVTVEMANRLRDRGYDVRIAHRLYHPLLRINSHARRITRRLAGMTADDWVADFRGPLVAFNRLSEVAFKTGEVVVAVGSHVAQEVFDLPSHVFKVRYCHDIAKLDGKPHPAWALPMTTLAVSPTLVDYLESMSGQPVDAVVPNGIDTQQYYNEHSERDAVGSVYSTMPRKAPEVLCEAMAKIRQCDPGIQRQVFSIGRRPPEFASDEYFRYPTVERARSIYNRARVWIVASTSEGFCLPILEAMACGAAVVSTDHDTVRGLIKPGHNGILVPMNDPEALAREAVRVFHDAALREKLVAASQETVTQFSWDAAVQKMEAFLVQLTASKSKAKVQTTA